MNENQELLRAWLEAQRVHDEHVGRFIAISEWTPDKPTPVPDATFTEAEIKETARLREVADEAHNAWLEGLLGPT